MSFVYLYFVLLGQGEEEGWMQILVFVVMAVIWAIGGIMKARADKQKKQKQQEKSQPVQPGLRPVQSKPAGRPQPVSSQKRLVTRPIPRPPEQRPTARPTFDSLFAPETIKQKIKEKILPQQKPVEMKAKPAVTPLKPAESTIQPEMVKVTDEKEETGAVVAESVLDFSEPEQLRAAIVHYEVFGKCVATRSAQEQIWMR